MTDGNPSSGRPFAQGPKKVTVKLDAGAVTAPAIRAMRTTSEILAISLDAIAKANLANIHLPGFFKLSFEPVEDAAAKRSLYEAWLLSKAFQELAKGVRESLEQAYIYVNALKLGTAGTTTWGAMQTRLAEIQREANRLNFPDLSAAVQSGLNGPLTFAEEFHSLQLVRNCLEHRDGVVGQLDLKGGPKLILKLPRLKMFTIQDGEEVELFQGQYFEAGAEVSVRRDTRVREFALGERITFSAVEFNEIAMACWFFANDLGKSLPSVPKPAGNTAKP